MKELINIQRNLKAPKNQYNSFGKYKYRSAEDILEALKPLLAENGCTLTLSDDVELIGTRFYVRATATIANSEGEEESVTALAREIETRAGMDGSQITGTASSYARKYALNGLFLIDDTKDADTDENHNEAKNKAATQAAQVNYDRQEILADIKTKSSRAELTKLWNDCKELRGETWFKEAVAKRTKEVSQ